MIQSYRCSAIVVLGTVLFASAGAAARPERPGSIVIRANGPLSATIGKLEPLCWDDLCSFSQIPPGRYEVEMRQKNNRLSATVEVRPTAQSRVRADFSTGAVLVHVPETEAIDPADWSLRSDAGLELRPFESYSKGFRTKRPFHFWAVASWVGTAERVTLLVRGPAGGGEGSQHDVYATKSGSSPVRLELEITSEVLARGGAFQLQAFVSSTKGETFGSLRTNAP